MDVKELQASDLLAGRDVPCPRCAYNLRDLTSNRCPECGLGITADTLLNRPPPPSPLPFGIALTGLAMGFFESCRYWTDLINGWLPSYGWIEDHGTLAQRWSSRLYWLSLIPLTILLLVLHRRFSRLPTVVRWSIAVIVAGAGLLGHRRLFLIFY